MTKAKEYYGEDATGTGGWVDDETEAERKAREARELRGEPETEAERKAREARELKGETPDERELREEATLTEKRRLRAVEKEAKLAREKEELRLKEPARSKLIRLLGELRVGAGGSVRKAALDELETTALGLKTEELVGESDLEKKLKEEREKGERERKVLAEGRVYAGSAEEKADEKAERERKAAEEKAEKERERQKAEGSKYGSATPR